MAVAIPDTYNYDRPVPKAPGDVTGYRVGEAPVVSDAPARAQAIIAQNEKELADDTEKFGASLDTTMAQDALNKLRAKRSDLTVGDNGFLKVRGSDVLKPGPDGRPIYNTMPERLQAQYDEIGGGLLSPRARRMFQTAAASEITGFKADLARHGLSESEKYQAAVFVDTKATLTDRAIQSVDDPAAFEENISRIKTAVKTRAAQIGMPSEALEKAAESDAVLFGIQKKIATGDTSALGFYEKYKDRLDPKDRITVEKAIDTMRYGVNAKAWVEGNSNSGPSGEVAKAGVKISMQHWEADGYSRPVAAGITAGFLRESQFSTSANNPRDGRDGSDSINIGQWNSSRAAAFKNFAAQNGLNPGDVKTGLAYAKAEIDGAIPYSVSGLNPDLKTKLQNAKSEKEAADIMTRDYFKPKFTEGESAIRQGSASAILAQYGQADNLAAADADMKLTPQERALYEHHLGNVAKGGVRNSDGSVSTLLQMTVEHDGKIYSVPTVWDNKKLTQDEAIARVEKAGWDKFPSYVSEAEAQARYDKLHTYLERDKAVDPLATAVNGTGAAPVKAASPNADGIVDARRMMIDIEQRKASLTAKANAEFGNNLPMLQQTLHQVEVQYTQGKANVQLYKDKLYADVQDFMSKGGPNGGPAITLPPANIFSQFTWEQQQSMERQVERNIAGKKTVTKFDVWYNIQQGLTSGDANVRDFWASAPLGQYAGDISTDHLKELANLQASVRKGDGKELTHVQTVTGMVNSALMGMGIDPTPKPGSGEVKPGSDTQKAAKFHRVFQDQLTEFETTKGKKADPQEMQKIIDGMVREVATTRTWWWGSDKKRFELKIRDVPEEDRAKIKDALTRAGKPVTDDAIIDLFSRKNAKPQ